MKLEYQIDLSERVEKSVISNLTNEFPKEEEKGNMLIAF